MKHSTAIFSKIFCDLASHEMCQIEHFIAVNLQNRGNSIVISLTLPGTANSHSNFDVGEVMSTALDKEVDPQERTVEIHYKPYLNYIYFVG